MQQIPSQASRAAAVPVSAPASFNTSGDDRFHGTETCPAGARSCAARTTRRRHPSPTRTRADRPRVSTGSRSSPRPREGGGAASGCCERDRRAGAAARRARSYLTRIATHDPSAASRTDTAASRRSRTRSVVSSVHNGWAPPQRPTPGGPRFAMTSVPASATSGQNRRRPTLPGPCEPSTIGAEGLNGSVRNGKRCFPLAIATANRRDRQFGGLQNYTAPMHGYQISVKPSTH
jgi:hypothetical protein